MRTLEFEDDGLLSQSLKHDLSDGLHGRCIDRELIDGVLKSANDELLQRGLVTSRAYIKPQDVQGGHLRISVFPGRLERVVEKPGMETTALLKMTFYGQQEQVLNLRELETALETIERLASVEASFDILPSDQPGFSQVVVKLKEGRPWHLQLGFSFNDDTNEPKATVSYEYDNPFRIGDRLRIRYNDDNLRSSNQGNEGHELGYEFPVGAYLYDLSASGLTYKRWVAGLNDTYLSEGDTQSLRLGVTKTVYRDQNDRLSLEFSLSSKDTETYFAGERIDVSSFRTTTARLDVSHNHNANWGTVASSLGVSRGLDWFGAREDDYFGRQSGLEDDALLQFTKWTWSERLSVPLFRSRWSWRSQLQAQYADEPLYSSEQLAVGGVYSVRGYQVPLSGSRGYFLRNDLVQSFNSPSTDPFDDAPVSKTVSWHIGYDYGEVLCSGGQNESCGVVAGLGLGFDLSSAQFQMALRWGYPLRETRFDSADSSRFDAFITWIF